MTDTESMQYYKDLWKKQIQKRDMVLKLKNNKEFKELVLKGYLQDFCNRVIKLSASDKILPEQRERFTRAAQATAFFEEYMEGIVQKGNAAEKSLQELDMQDAQEDVSYNYEV